MWPHYEDLLTFGTSLKWPSNFGKSMWALFNFPTLELFVKLCGLVYEALQPVPANLICVKINK